MTQKKLTLGKSRADRRKTFGKLIDMNYYYDSTGKSRPVWPKGCNTPKVMNNFDRRKLGIDQDPALEDYKE